MATQPSAPLADYSSPSKPTLRATQQLLKSWIDSLPRFPRRARFISKVKRIAAETRAAQRFEKHCAKQVVLNRISTQLKEIANGLERAIEREAKEKGEGILTYEIVQPDTAEAKVFPQLPRSGRALIIEDDIRQAPGFAQLTAQCAAIGVKLELIERWSNIDWNPFLGGNADLVWHITISGW
ncbi:MAG: hypothetical protein EXR70_08120 [Deltaproteobacteria bacterium]|nr:hypothetical protein [Deltaproteobacteria bacterium]